MPASSCEGSAARQRNDLVPNLRVEYLPIDALRSADRRVRRAMASQSARVELSLKRFGICVPILIDSEGRIVHGHVVWEAARRLGIETIPVIRMDHLNESERRALSIALNRLAETGDWDIEALKVEFEDSSNSMKTSLRPVLSLRRLTRSYSKRTPTVPNPKSSLRFPSQRYLNWAMSGSWGAIDWFRATHATAKPISASSYRMSVSGSL